MSSATIEKDGGATEFAKPKVVSKVFNLPVVTDTYDSLAKISTPLHPYFEKAGSIASPVVDCAFTVSGNLPTIPALTEFIESGFSSAKEQVQFIINAINHSFRRLFQLQRLWMPASVQSSTAWWTRFQL